MKKADIKIALLNLSAATLLGGLLRFMPMRNIEGLNYRFFLHAHSHVAFLGWVYMALYVIILFSFIPEEKRIKRSYKTLFLSTQVSVVGMLITFPIQGYALFSIIFSTLHILLSYIFTYKVIKDTSQELKSKLSYKLLLASLLFMVLSSLGPWSLGIIMSKGLSGSNLYNLAIYFYLHFIYNGFFTLAILGILLRFFETRGMSLPEATNQQLLWSLVLSALGGYALSTLWTKPGLWVYAVSFLSASLQLWTLRLLAKILREQRLISENMPSAMKVLLYLSALAFVVKVVLQFISVFTNIYYIRNVIIAYLHLTLIGFVTFFLIAWLLRQEYMKLNRMAVYSIFSFITGFLLSETILFIQGGLFLAGKGLIPSYDLLLFIASIFMPIGAVLLTISQYRTGRQLEVKQE